MTFQELYKLIHESKSTPIVVVDVQPAYANWSREANMICEKVVEFLSQSSTGPILMFVNADETGLTEDSIDDIKYWYEENGFDDWGRVEIIDKGYGYLRPWMDSGVSAKSIIGAIRHMYQNRYTDSRAISETYDDSEAQEKWQDVLQDDSIPEDSISVEWLSVGKLKQYSGCYIVGGGRDECLREVELMMNAFNIKYTRIESLVY